MEQPAVADNINAECRNEPSPSDVVCSLEILNDDCLFEILQYLDIMDIVNLSRASERLHQFAKTFIFPKAVKVCFVSVLYNRKDRFDLSFNRRRSMEIDWTPESLETAFRYFGEFVEDLELFNFMNGNLLTHCQNLKKLYFNTYTYSRTHDIQNQIEGLQYLEELKVNAIPRFTHKWRASNGISNVTKLSLGKLIEVNGNFIGYFKNLTSLSVEIRDYNSRIDNLAQILENNKHSLKHLKVTDDSSFRGSGSFAQLIYKLYKLESLELDFRLTDEKTFFIQLPHLKSVVLECKDDYSVNSTLRTLSDNETIEELTIKGGVFDESIARTQPPLSFLKLRGIAWINLKRFSDILKLFSKSIMPEIQAFELDSIDTDDLDSLIGFIKSKNTLKTMKLHFSNSFIPLSFWTQIIGLLKKSATQRLLITVVIKIPLVEEVWELLKANRNIIRVEKDFVM